MIGKLCLAALLSLGCGLVAAEPAAPDAPALNRQLLSRFGDSAVKVDTFFKVNAGGEMPEMHVQYLCPNCGSYHTRGVDELIKQRRPMSQPGYAVAPDEIIATDLYLVPEWLDRIEVVFRDKSYPAVIAGYYPDRNAVKLKLKTAPEGLKPLQFEPLVPDTPKFDFFVVEDEGLSIAGLLPDHADSAFRNLETGLDYRKLKPNTLLVDASGKVATLNMSDKFPLDGNRFAPPAAWPFESAAERQAKLDKFAAELKANVYPVRLRLAVEDSNTPQIMRRMNRDEKNKNEFDGIGVKLADGRMLVNFRLDPSQTARLDRIFILDGDKMIDCDFIGSLDEFGALLVKPKEALPGKGFAFYPKRPSLLLDQVLNTATIRNFDGKLRIHPQPVRLTGVETGRDNRLMAKTTYQNREHGFLFTPDHRILQIPLIRRDNLERYSADHAEPVSGQQLAEVFQSDRLFDPNNIPRQAADRNQTAWLGADFQGLTPELARDNNGSTQTENGQKGILITNVQPDSPAAKLGLQAGDILLYLRPADSQQRITLEGYEFSRNDYLAEFPWDRYDQIPERFFDQIPTPWPPAENELTNRLTKLGVGRKIALGILRNGELGEKELTLEKMPANFSSAPRFVDKNIGLTVVEPTFEVRNFFRMKPDDPGLLIAKIRPGSPASVAGLKPYEIILSIDDQNVKSVKDFEALVKDKTSFNFAVRRLAATRVVKFQLPPPATP